MKKRLLKIQFRREKTIFTFSSCSGQKTPKNAPLLTTSDTLSRENEIHRKTRFYSAKVSKRTLIRSRSAHSDMGSSCSAGEGGQHVFSTHSQICVISFWKFSTTGKLPEWPNGSNHSQNSSMS